MAACTMDSLPQGLMYTDSINTRSRGMHALAEGSPGHMRPVRDMCVQADAALPAHALGLAAAHRLTAQLALFALAGKELTIRQLHPALQDMLAAQNSHKYATAASAYLQVPLARCVGD